MPSSLLPVRVFRDGDYYSGIIFTARWKNCSQRNSFSLYLHSIINLKIGLTGPCPVRISMKFISCKKMCARVVRVCVCESVCL